MAVHVHIEALSHHYRQGERPALVDVGFDVAAGERVGLLGPNGAGKSTLMRILCGYLPVQAGRRTTVLVDGLDVATHSLAVRERVGYLPEHVPLHPELKTFEHLRFRARIKGLPWRKCAADIDRVAAMTGIAGVLDVPIHTLSRGYRQRVGIADALLADPALLVLDEPTVGLDPNQVIEIRSMLRRLGGSHTMLFSSHILAEVELLCDRVLILSEGRLAADEPIAVATRAGRVHVAWADPATGARDAIAAALVGVGLRAIELDLRREGGRVLAEVPCHDGEREVASEALLAAIGQASSERNLIVLRLEPARARLEERFAEVTGVRLGTREEGLS